MNKFSCVNNSIWIKFMGLVMGTPKKEIIIRLHLFILMKTHAHTGHEHGEHTLHIQQIFDISLKFGFFSSSCTENHNIPAKECVVAFFCLWRDDNRKKKHQKNFWATQTNHNAFLIPIYLFLHQTGSITTTATATITKFIGNKIANLLIFFFSFCLVFFAFFLFTSQMKCFL